MWIKSAGKKGQAKGLDSIKEMAANMGKKQAVKKSGPGGGAEGQKEQEAVPVRCYKIALMDFKDDLPVMGTVKGGLEIPLKFEINGVIEAINFREGDVVNKGDVIASLSKKDAQLKVDYAKAKLESAKTQALAAKKKYEIHKSLTHRMGDRSFGKRHRYRYIVQV